MNKAQCDAGGQAARPDNRPSGRMTMSNENSPVDAAFDTVAATARVKGTLEVAHEARTHNTQHALAASTYKAFCEAVGGKMTPFEDLAERQKNAWVSAAEAARSFHGVAV